MLTKEEIKKADDLITAFRRKEIKGEAATNGVRFLTDMYNKITGKNYGYPNGCSSCVMNNRIATIKKYILMNERKSTKKKTRKKKESGTK